MDAAARQTLRFDGTRAHDDGPAADPDPRFSARCCLGKPELLPQGSDQTCGDDSSADCATFVGYYCALPGNMDDPACANACAVDAPPDWCTTALRAHCSANAGLLMSQSVCKTACPLKLTDGKRDDFCTDAAQALCVPENTGQYCSCINTTYGELPDVIDKYCLPPCADTGYQSGSPPKDCPNVCVNIVQCGDRCDINAINACKETYGNGGGSGVFGAKIGPVPAWIVVLAGVALLAALALAVLSRPSRAAR